MGRPQQPLEHRLLLTATFCLLAGGAVMVYSASSARTMLQGQGDGTAYLIKYVGYGAVGLIAMHLISRLDLRLVRRFTAAFLIGKTVESIRIVGNLGFLILEDPSQAAEQDDLLTYGLSLARAVADGFELVSEINGRANFAETVALGAEDRGLVRVGARFTRGAVRVDGGLMLGLSPRDPDWGFTAGLTWVVDAFRVP